MAPLPPRDELVPLQLPADVQTTPDWSGKVQVLAWVRSREVRVPVKEDSPWLTGDMVIGSELLGFTLNIPVFSEEMVPEPKMILPAESTVRYLLVPLWSATEKISLLPEVYPRIESGVIAEVAVMVWVLPGSDTRQLVHSPPLPPCTTPHDGTPLDTVSTDPGDPIPRLPMVLLPVAYGRSPRM